MNIKVSGITTMKQLQQLDGLDVGFAGLIFSKKSLRYIGDGISKKDMITADLDIKTVGIFEDAGYDEIMKIVETYKIDIVQLHGSASAELCEQISAETEVIKSFIVADDTQIDDMVQEYDDACDYYLFHGLSGIDHESDEKFNWEKVAKSKIEKPFFIGGGILPGDGPLLKKFRHPDLYGVDINDHFEKEPGIKDMAEVLKFIRSIK